MVSVSESARRSGVGSELMKKAEDWAKEQGCTEMHLITINPAARAFYHHLGYHDTGYFAPGLVKAL